MQARYADINVKGGSMYSSVVSSYQWITFRTNNVRYLLFFFPLNTEMAKMLKCGFFRRNKIIANLFIVAVTWIYILNCSSKRQNWITCLSLGRSLLTWQFIVRFVIVAVVAIFVVVVVVLLLVAVVAIAAVNGVKADWRRVNRFRQIQSCWLKWSVQISTFSSISYLNEFFAVCRLNERKKDEQNVDSLFCG